MLLPAPVIQQLKETTPQSGFVTLRDTSPHFQVQATGWIQYLLAGVLSFQSFSSPGQQLLKTEASIQTALFRGGTFPPPTTSQYTGQLMTQIFLFE